MRAALVRAYGEPPQLEDFGDPSANGQGELVVEVLAAGLNPVDLHLASGDYVGGSPPLPYVAGREGVGRTADGQRVYFDAPIPPHGSFAQRAVVAAESCVSLPDGVDDGLAIACGIAGRAAWLSLEYRARLQPGETVLVLGASGTVGQIAIQAATLMGAGPVLAAARSDDGLRRAGELGASATVKLDGERGAIVDRMRAAAPDGIDVVIDPVWGSPAEAAVEALAPRGRLVQLGAAAGERASFSSNAVRGKALTILGHVSWLTPRDVARAAYERLSEHAARGELTADVEQLPLADVAEAWERQGSGPGCKLVLVP
ncbi:MAG: quinone oxidoreductase family protein [Solirubrobacteraceae bacterium]